MLAMEDGRSDGNTIETDGIIDNHGGKWIPLNIKVKFRW